ncbi:MAG: hypothetical protein B7Y56_03145 [Gallionellales bacterium 35-53-114]|jgi:hypothetical protein|nr:MAG: hypothetical protein B7Y56_03145 [Gallionellales bacterium 35-53-114]OYZ65104.1 MAG: hypothetical protein B7Y04_00305 [Gallionellales bacterium 24-53-125]OZB08013.1 MAG: hypothetical protein B7X61_10755 [Gallionellales bacterium 39-52-133]HQS59754.1 hypothetical protein [Gallionellaceae bacterium]HQS76508.1 hypothetical protein [Gallionellaceae bacterium]
MSQPINITYTPGPWIWSEEGYSLRPEFPQPDTHHIHTILDLEMCGCGFAGSKLEDSLKEDKANHALIAAAPELLEALSIAEEFMRGFEGDEAQVGMEIKLAIIRHALSKARGQHE